MKFFRKNGEPAMKTNSGRCSSSKPNVRRNSSTNRPAVISHTAPPSANTSHTGTLSVNSDDDRADQRALGEAEMIVDQQMDVGDVRRQRDLVEENPDDDGGIDGKHQAPGIFPHPQISFGTRNDQIRRRYHMPNA